MCNSTNENVSSCEFAVVSVGDLGFQEGAKLDEIYARAAETGLEVFPNAGALGILLSSKKLEGERFVVASKPYTGADNLPHLTYLMRGENGKLHSGTHSGHPSYIWRPEFKFLFRQQEHISRE